ncbi:MAG: hypothetical protein V4547_17705 [Bacteroidota bacterium]
MSKTLKLDLDTAKRLYPNSQPEFKELLEQNFGKEAFKPIPIEERIADYDDVCEILGVDSDDKTIKIEVPGFDKGQLDNVLAFIKKMRVVEAYNGQKRCNRGDKRWYNWYTLKSGGSGLVFGHSHYYVDHARTGSAARLAFLSEHHLRDARSKFHYIDEQLIDL